MFTNEPGRAAPLVSETPNRHDLIGLDLVNSDTGETEGHVPFTRDEIDMPGYVEHVEKGYQGTSWRPVRIWRTADTTAD